MKSENGGTSRYGASSSAPSITNGDGNRIVRISDLGRVELGSEEETANVRHNGKDAVYLSVWPLPGTNEIAVAYALRAELENIRKDLPAGTDIGLAYDGTVYMENSLKEIAKTFSETVLIVGLIVFLFLGSIRSALVPLPVAAAVRIHRAARQRITIPASEAHTSPSTTPPNAAALAAKTIPVAVTAIRSATHSSRPPARRRRPLRAACG